MFQVFYLELPSEHHLTYIFESKLSKCLACQIVAWSPKGEEFEHIAGANMVKELYMSSRPGEQSNTPLANFCTFFLKVATIIYLSGIHALISLGWGVYSVLHIRQQYGSIPLCVPWRMNF